MSQEDINAPGGGQPELDKDLSEKLTASGIDEDTVNSIKTLSAQRGHYKSKYEREEATRKEKEAEIERLARENAELKVKITPPPPASAQPAPVAPVTVDDTWKSKMEFLVLHKDKIDPEDFPDLEVIAKGSGKTLAEAMDTDAWKAIASVRVAKRATAASAVAASNASEKVQGKVELTPEDKEVARKLNLSEESFLKSKIKHSS